MDNDDIDLYVAVVVNGQAVLHEESFSEYDFCNFSGDIHEDKDKDKKYAIFNHSCRGHVTPHLNQKGELTETFMMSESQLTRRMNAIQRNGGEASETVKALRALRR